MKELKKILIISYFYPPSNFAGTYRIESWAKDFHKWGLYPIIVTRNWSPNQSEITHKPEQNNFKIVYEKGYEVHYLPYEQTLRDRIHQKYGPNKYVFLRKSLSLFEMIIQNYSISVLGYKNIYHYSKKLIIEQKTHAIITSGRPFQQFHIAHKLSKFYNLPWIADYRDEWTTCQWIPSYNMLSRLLHKLERKSELKWTKNLSFFVSCSDNLVSSITHLINKRGVTILNGFNPNDYVIESNQKIIQNKFTITFNGTLYSSMDYTTFLHGVRLFQKKYSSLTIELLFPGILSEPESADKIEIELKKQNLNYLLLPRIDKTKVIELQINSDVLLMIAYNGVKGIYSSKIFEYLGCNRPILLSPGDNDVLDSLIKETGTGEICNTPNEVCDFLVKVYNSKNADKPFLTKNNDAIKKYTREYQSQLFANEINRII